MSIDPKASASDKLKSARDLYIHASDHFRDNRAEMHRASRFYHNTKGEGQWEPEDIKSLRDKGRPHFSFNVCKIKINTWIGMYKDSKRKPSIKPTGAEDIFTAETLERVADAVYKRTDMETVDAYVMQMGVIKGECNAMVDVQPDPDNPAFSKICIHKVSPHDVYWDPNSEEPDRSDARYFFHGRWLSELEFKAEYPDHADSWEHFTQGVDGSEGATETGGHGETSNWFDDEDEDYTSRNLFYDRHKNEALVVHCEYKVPVERIFVINPANGKSRAVSKEKADIVRRLIRLGDPQFAQAEVRTTWDDVVYSMEFAGSKILWESDEKNLYQPYDGFSMVPFVCYMDTEDGVAYGMMRDLFDPQQEVNKAKSVSLDHLANQNKPGWIAEEDAVADADTFDEQVKSSGETAWVKPGAIAAGKLQERSLPQLSPAVVQRGAEALDFIDRISGLEGDPGNPAAAQEAATTVQIRYRKARMSMGDVWTRYEKYQMEIKKRVVQAIVYTMPDAQIAAMIGDPNRFQVQNGTVTEVKMDPETGQPRPVNRTNIRNMRAMEYDIELLVTSENEMLRAMDQAAMTDLFKAGAPVDPVLLVENVSSSAAMRDRLRKYAEDRSMAEAASQKAMQEQQERTVAAMIGTENFKTQEQRRHNRVEEAMKAQKQADQHQTNLLKIYEQADEAEMKALLDMEKIISERQKQRMRDVTTIQ